ncbi:MAG: hypothetical protein HPY62_07610 [Bacteroidales bacterium]|nr:hypothetical protein [Bacteroidales bacterium]
MNKQATALIALVIILAFMAYIITNATKNEEDKNETGQAERTVYSDNWSVSSTLPVSDGKLLSVASSDDGNVIIGGDAFIKSLRPDLSEEWTLQTEMKITSLSVYNDTIFASTPETILLYSRTGNLINEWGPYETGAMITSVSASKKLVAFADAGNKIVYVLRKNGELYSMIGHSESKFIIPSPYFDIALYNDQLFIAHTGNRRIETWTVDGRKLSEFGEPGTAPGAFCGCCNPSHFAVVPQGFITAEKGINRIKILGHEGNFLEFVSSSNNFTPSVPLDVASADGKTIYAANSMNSTLYIFTRN